MNGKSFSYYYMHKGKKGFLKVTAGKVKEDGAWEFYSELAEFPDNISFDVAEGLAVQFVSTFMAAKAQHFYAGKIEANTDDFGHPKLVA